MGSDLAARRQRFWAMTMRGRPKCAACGGRRYLQAHHAIPRQTIRSQLASYEPDLIEAFSWDARNGVVLCSEPAPNRCHERHTLAVHRLPRAVLNPAVWEFAAELDGLAAGEPFTAYLEANYR